MIESAWTHIATIVGLIGGSVITLWGAVYLARRQLFNVAASKLIRAFSPEIAALNNQDPAASIKAYDVLSAAFAKHQAAVTEFRFFLKEYQCTGFDQAWEAYRKHSADFSPEWPNHQEMNHLGEYLSINDEEEQKVKRLALSRIKAVLRYANA